MLPIPDDQRRAGSLPNDVFGDAPRNRCFNPVRPCVDMMIRSAGNSLAASIISKAGWPLRTDVSVETWRCITLVTRSASCLPPLSRSSASMARSRVGKRHS